MAQRDHLQSEKIIESVRQVDDEEIEIDLRQLFFELKNKILVIILAGLIAGGAVGAFSKFVLKPVYTSTSVLYVLSKETTLTSLADLQIGSQLTQDYKELIMSRTVMERVIDNLSLEMDSKDLEEKISIENPSNTRILQISADDGDPVMAKRITDEVASCSSEYIAEIMEMIPPKIVETGEVPIYKTSPHVMRDTAIGALIGMLIVMGMITYQVATNDSVRTEDDVEKYMGLPVLAVVPEVSDIGGKNDKKKKSSSKQKKGSSSGKSVRSSSRGSAEEHHHHHHHHTDEEAGKMRGGAGNTDSVNGMDAGSSPNAAAIVEGGNGTGSGSSGMAAGLNSPSDTKANRSGLTGGQSDGEGGKA